MAEVANKKHFAAYLDADVVDRMREFAHDRSIFLAEAIEQAMTEYLDRQEEAEASEK